jgi:hypothetical protein
VLTARGGLQDRVIGLRSVPTTTWSSRLRSSWWRSSKRCCAGRPAARTLAAGRQPRIRHRKPAGIHRRQAASSLGAGDGGARAADATQDRVVSRSWSRTIFRVVGRGRVDAVEVYVHRLRKQLSERGAKVQIHTIRGVGYLIAEEKAV